MAIRIRTKKNIYAILIGRKGNGFEQESIFSIIKEYEDEDYSVYFAEVLFEI